MGYATPGARDNLDWRGDGQSVSLADQIAGERNADSETNGYMATKEECNATRIIQGVSVPEEHLITNAPAYLLGVVCNASHDGNIDIRDAAATAGGSTAIFVLDLNDQLTIGYWGAVRFENGITAEFDNVAGDATFLWRPI